jgi:hypothetical protein
VRREHEFVDHGLKLVRTPQRGKMMAASTNCAFTWLTRIKDAAAIGAASLACLTPSYQEV